MYPNKLIIGSHVYETVSHSPSRRKVAAAHPTLLVAQSKKGAAPSPVHTKARPDIDIATVQQTMTRAESTEIEPEKKKSKRFTLRKKN